MFNPGAFENSRPDGVAVLEAPGLLFVPLKKTDLSGEVVGPLASFTVCHTFGYTRSQSAKTLEAVYRFPLPGDAAVTAIRVCFGDVEIAAALKARAEAEADYAAAKREGMQAALVTRGAPDVFTLQVTGIKPDEDILIETSYVQLARPEGPGWSLRIPLTTAPRYMRSDERLSTSPEGQPLLLLRDPGHRFSLDILIAGTEMIDSPTHSLGITDEDGWARVRLQEGSVIPDRDCVIVWQLPQKEERPVLEVLTHEDAKEDWTYFLAMVVPPTAPERQVPLEAILLVDHSGSMEGTKWAAADWTVKKFLAGLSEIDAMNLCLFHSTTRWLAQEPRTATPRTVEDAKRFVDTHRDSGGTELGVALEQALHLRRSDGDRSRHALIITDAQVSDMGRILRLVEEESRQQDRRRVSMICIDAAPNSFLVVQAAEKGGGLARFLTSEPGEGDITTALDQILADWLRPVYAGLRLGINRPGLQASGRELLRQAGGGEAVDAGDLPAGRPLWVAGRVRGQAAGLEFDLTGDQRKPLAAVHISQPGRPLPQLKALFGAWRVLGLDHLVNAGYGGEQLAEELRRLGYDPAVDLTGERRQRPLVYAENVRDDSRKALGDLLRRESLDYGLLSSATGFVAVRRERGDVVEETVPVASPLPTGWSDRFISQPMAWLARVVPDAATSGAAGPYAPDQSMTLSPRDLAPRFRRASFPRLFQQSFSAGPRQEAAPPSPPVAKLFAGVPSFRNGRAVLCDIASFAQGDQFSRLRVRLTGRRPARAEVDSGLVLLLFVDDLSEPFVRVRLIDMLEQNGERPINLTRLAGKRVMLVLTDETGAWASKTPRIEVELVQ